MAIALRSAGVSFSNDGRVKRLKSRFAKFKDGLEEVHGKTQQPTGKPAIASLIPALLKQVLEVIEAPQEVKEKVRKLVTVPKS